MLAVFFGIKSTRFIKASIILIFGLGCLGVSPLAAAIFSVGGSGEPKDLLEQTLTKEEHEGDRANFAGGMPSEGSPSIIDTGVYVKSLGKLNYKDNNFFINLYIWWLSDNPDYYPEKTVQITNAENTMLQYSARDWVNNKYRSLARYTATINCTPAWNLQHFPYDRQIFRISFEDNISDIEKIRFSLLSSDSKISPDVIFNDWQLDKFEIVHEPHIYSTNFGDTVHPESVYSRINLIFNIKRLGDKLFFVTFVGFFVSFFLSCITFFVPKRYFDANNTLCLGAIFAATGNNYQLNSIVPFYELSSLMGVVVISTFGVVLVAILNNLIVHVLMMEEKIKLSRVVNFSTFIILFTLYGYVVGSALQAAIES